MMKYEPQHMREDLIEPNGEHIGDDAGATGISDAVGNISPEDNTAGMHAHPLGIPIPDQGSPVEFVPIPGKGSTEYIAANGAVVRNPWSEQPEIKPDNEYTPEQEDLNLIQL